MATPRFAWGIDIGNRALKAVKLVPSADGLRIDDFDVVEHETVLSASGDNRDALVQTALAAFVGRHPGIEKGQVGVSVNGQRTFAKFIKLPPVEKNKIPEIVRFEAIQQIPFPLDDVEWAYHLFQDPESPDVEVGIFAMRKEQVNAHIGFFTEANLNVQVVQVAPLSVYNAMYYDSRIKGTTMVVDVGAESTDLIIAEGEGVWLRSIPIGGNNFTEALTKSFKVDFDKAEELKRNATTSRYSRQIVQAMRPIFADLVSEIQRSMGFYGSTHKDSKITRVLALGSTFRLPGLERYLQQNLSLEVKKLDRLGTVNLEDPKLAASFNENLLSSAGAYGLALQVMGQGKIASSLLPEHIRRAKMWREKNKWFAAAAALFVAGTAVAYGSYYASAGQMETATNQGIKSDIATVEGKARKLDADWSAVESAGGTDLQRIKNVEALVDDHGVWPQINNLLHDTLPQFSTGQTEKFQAGDPAELKKVPRRDRKQIVVSAATSKYSPDVAAYLAAPDLSPYVDPTVDQGLPNAVSGDAGTLGSGYTVTTTTGTPPRGYVLTLKCSTPNAAGPDMFVKYKADLLASPPTAQRPWKVAAATIVRQNALRDDQAKMAAMVAAYQQQKDKQAAAAPPGQADGGDRMPPFDPSAGMRGAVTGFGQTATNGVPDEAFQDPELGEDVRNDTEAVIVLLVQLDVQPPAPAAPPAGAPPKAVATATP